MSASFCAIAGAPSAACRTGCARWRRPSPSRTRRGRCRPPARRCRCVRPPVGQGDAQAVAARAEQGVLGDRALVQGDRTGIGGADAHLVLGLADHESRRVGRHGRPTGRACRPRGRSRRDHGWPARAPLVTNCLLPSSTQRPSCRRARAQVVRLGAGLRLGQAEGADQFAARRAAQVAVLLRFGAVVQDGTAAYRSCARSSAWRRPRSRWRSPRWRARRPRSRYRCRPTLGHDHAQQAERAHLLHHLRRQRARLVPLRGAAASRSLAKARAVSRIMICSSV